MSSFLRKKLDIFFQFRFGSLFEKKRIFEVKLSSFEVNIRGIINIILVDFQGTCLFAIVKVLNKRALEQKIHFPLSPQKNHPF
jgi:hypothetical protein